MLSVLNNMAALTATTNLQGATASQTSSIKRLSTGLRINQASDDASGLAISEKMRTQIRGLNKANENSQNGISMLQTAEGALNETHSILQRMRELAVQASNGTLTSNDRIEVQKEVDALKDEIDGISTRTEFNTKKLLTGDATGFASFSTSEMGATFTGGKVSDGEYQLEIDAKAGLNQVQASSIFRVKEGVQSVDSENLNPSAAEHKLSLNLDSVTNVDSTLEITITMNGVDYDFTSGAVTLDADDLTASMASLSTEFFAVGGSGADAGLSSIMDLTISGGTAIFTAKDPSVDFTIKVDEVGAGQNLNVEEEGQFDIQHRSSKSGVSEFTNLNNLTTSPTAEASYDLVVDQKGDGSLILDRLESVSGQDAGSAIYNDDIYHIMGSSLQPASEGFGDAKLDLDLAISTAALAGDVISMDFNLDGDPNNTITFEYTLVAGTQGDMATDFADAFNADNRLNGSIRAEADGGELKFYALDENRALDYKVQIDATDGNNATAFADSLTEAGMTDLAGVLKPTAVYDAQFVTGMGKLGVSGGGETDAAFTTNSNSHHGTEAILEFMTDGSIGEAGLDARVSFDGGDSWTYVENVWDGGATDKTATDGYYSLDFNREFTNNGQPGNFQAGDRILLAMNDNANENPTAGAIEYNDYSLAVVDSGADSNISMEIDVAGEIFKFDVDLEAASKDLAGITTDFINEFNSVVGSDGSRLSDVISVTYGSGNLNFAALQDDFTMIHSEAGTNVAADAIVTRRFHNTDGDLTRIDAFDPNSGQFQMGVVTSHLNNALDEKMTTLKIAYMDQENGHVSLGSVDAKFSLNDTGTLPTDGVASFTATENGGGDVQASTTLMDIDRFYNADGQFILGENGETFSIYNAYGDKADVYIDGGDSLNDVVDKLREAITGGVADGGLGVSTGNSELDENIVSFVTASTSGSIESQQGSIVIRSALSGANGRIFISGSEQLKTALGLSEVQNATENELDVIVKDNLSGIVVGKDTVSDNIIHNIIDGVEIEIDQSYDLQASYDDKTKNFVFKSEFGSKIETVKIVNNSTDFQIGANQGQTLNVNIMQSDAHSLKVDRVQVTDADEAKEAITQVDKAIDMVSSERAKIGAWVNRLEHTMANLDVQSENQTAAESRIRDLNIAKETTEMSKSQILAQASTSMLAQANQQSQGLMSLLR